MIEALPVMVIGGYLGAGKTTLINELLLGDHGRRIAVIVNDFGDVAIDDALLGPATGGVRSLANGCVCCTAVDGLGTAMREIRDLDPPAELVVIEVSGVGDPWAVAQWGRTPGFALDGAVVVVDPETTRTWAEDRYVGETVIGQIGAADLIVISRTDIVSNATVQATADWIATLTAAPTVPSPGIELDVLLGPDPVRRPPAAIHAQHRSFAFEPRSVDRAQLSAWLESAPTGVVRVKGLVDSDEGQLVAQRFGHRSEISGRGEGLARPPAMTVIAGPGTDPEPVEHWCGQLRA